MSENNNTAPQIPDAGNPQRNPDLEQRVVDLEAALARMTHQREETRRMLFDLQSVAFPDDPPPTEAELLEERQTLVEVSISQMISELEEPSGAGQS